MKSKPLSNADLSHILEHTVDVWEQLTGGTLFITGGTGFIGQWLLESLFFANDQLGLNAKAIVLTRSPSRFEKKAAHITKRNDIELICGDVRDFSFPKIQPSHIIHAGTAASVTEDAKLQMSSIVDGTRQVIKFASSTKCRKLLYVSSGAVYGSQPPTMRNMSEEYCGGPNLSCETSAYGEGKRAAELFCLIENNRAITDFTIARCFTFIGPHLPLGAHYAAGNFLRDVLCNRPICINGDGSPFRSYLYSADLTIWLWRILFCGSPGRQYNVGSEDSKTIREVANCIAASACSPFGVKVSRQLQISEPAKRYVPDTTRAQKELSLKQWIDFDSSIARTLAWHAKS